MSTVVLLSLTLAYSKPLTPHSRGAKLKGMPCLKEDKTVRCWCLDALVVWKRVYPHFHSGGREGGIPIHGHYSISVGCKNTKQWLNAWIKLMKLECVTNSTSCGFSTGPNIFHLQSISYIMSTFTAGGENEMTNLLEGKDAIALKFMEKLLQRLMSNN